MLCFDPTRGIDVGTKRQIYALLRELAEAGAAILLFTSELPEIQLVCDRTIVVYRGKVTAEMPARAGRRAGAAEGRARAHQGRGGGGMTTVEDAVGRTRRFNTRRIATRHGWTIGVYVLLVLLIIAYAWALAPVAFTSFDLASIVIGALPLAFAAMAQAVIVISGGIDLSLGVIVAVINVSAASLMEGQSFATALLIAFGLMLLGALIGAINGGLMRGQRRAGHRRHARDVVRLGRHRAGDHAHARRRGADPVPVARHRLVRLRVDPGRRGASSRSWLLAVWLPLRWRRPGLRDLRDRLQPRRARTCAASTSCRTRVLAYAVGGFFAAMGGLAATATTGIGTRTRATSYTLNSVAAVVLGGVSLAGGKGGLVGPVAAAFCLTLVPSIMVFQGIDPNYGQVIQGALIVVVVMLGGLLLLRERHERGDHDARQSSSRGRNRAARPARAVIDRPLIMLGVILVLLLILCEIVSPGYMSSERSARSCSSRRRWRSSPPGRRS